jgi:hypothetical protein
MDAVQLLQKPVLRNKAEIASLIKQWRASGKNKTTFCRENNLVYMTFIGWTSAKKKEKEKLSGFIPLRVNKATPKVIGDFFAEINLRDGSKVIFHREVSAQYLRSVLR